MTNSTATAKFRLGLIVNPVAGIGGRVGLKGSDGEDIRKEAMARGAQPLANARAAIALQQLTDLKERLLVFTAANHMGEYAAAQAGLDSQLIYHPPHPEHTTAADTRELVETLQQTGVDLILFAGGDGTARDIFAVIDEQVPVVGIPAGCKIHSGVYAITPEAAGKLVRKMVQGELLSLKEASVMDIDEQAFRAGVVKARRYGEMRIPDSLHYMQSVKSGGKESEPLVLADMAAFVVEQMEPDVPYFIGSGSTCAEIMKELGLPNTLLGIDVVKNGQLVQPDATEAQLLAFCRQPPLPQAFITVIGGQGHLLGRGNQQLSAEVIEAMGWSAVTVLATKSKLQSLRGRPLRVDTGNPQLDRKLSGSKSILCGYDDWVTYRIEALPED